MFGFMLIFHCPPLEQDVNRSQAAGFATHLTKPVRIDSLESALDFTLRAPAGSHA